MRKISKIEAKSNYDESHSHNVIKNQEFKDNAPHFVSVVGPALSGKSSFITGIIRVMDVTGYH